MKEFVGHVFNVPNSKDFEHVENVLHETFTASKRRATLAEQPGHPVELIESKGFSCTG